MTHHQDSRVLIIALALPIALTAVALGIALAWLPQLPPTVALNWGRHGADGFGPRWILPVLLAAVGFGVPVLLGGIVVLTSRPVFGFGQKLISAVSLATTAFLVVVLLAAVGLQRGLEQAADAPTLLPAVGVGAAIAVVLGVGAWFVLPNATRPADGWRAAAPLSLTADERAVWIGTARFPVWGIAAILVPTLAIAVVTSGIAAQRGGLVWLLLLVPVALFVLVLSATDFRVRVDAAGLQVRSILGFPRWTVAAGDIAEAGTTTVAGLSDFGGWGVRVGRGSRVGIITRDGSALEVRRRNGSSLVVTVDDAEAAAALLTARVRSGS